MSTDPSKSRWAVCATLGVASLLSGCIFVAEDDGPLVGSLTIEWTIEGRQDLLDCIDLGADRMEIVLYAGGDVVDQIEPPCEAFGVSIDLVEGRYHGDATLIDRADRSVTITEPVDAIDVIGGTELLVDIDFPLGAFL